MSEKKIHLICNAHLDTDWLWEWEEGAAEAISTFRTAADLCEEFDSFVFNHNEVILYQSIEEYEPTLFERIERLVRAGKWYIFAAGISNWIAICPAVNPLYARSYWDGVISRRGLVSNQPLQ